MTAWPKTTPSKRQKYYIFHVLTFITVNTLTSLHSLASDSLALSLSVAREANALAPQGAKLEFQFEARFDIAPEDYCGKNYPLARISNNRLVVPLLDSSRVSAIIESPQCPEFRNHFRNSLLVSLIEHWDRSQPKPELLSKQIAKCRHELARSRHHKNPHRILSAQCQHYASRKAVYGDSLEYLSLSLFRSKHRSKDLSRASVLHHSEYDSSFRHFSLNLTQYLTDPDYSCRRPAMAQYFRDSVGVEGASRDNPCLQPWVVEMQDSRKIELDISRIAEIHYLLVDGGEGMASNFGHSMYRIVMCAGADISKPESCRHDAAPDVVITFRGFVDDFHTHPWKGLTGHYPSLIFFKLYSGIQQEYAAQGRNLYSLPIRMNEKQRSLFVRKAAEMFWDYRGAYYFVWRNCATESWELAQSALQIPRLYFEYTLFPNGILTILEKHGLIAIDQSQPSESRNTRERIQESTELFYSGSTIDNEDQENIKDLGIILSHYNHQPKDDPWSPMTAPNTIKEWIHLGSVERRAIFDRLIENQNNETISRHALLFGIIEERILEILMARLDRAYGQALAEQMKGPQGKEIQKKLELYQSGSRQVLQSSRSQKDWGIPLDHSVLEKNKNAIQQGRARWIQAIRELKDLLHNVVPILQNEARRTQANVKYFDQRL